MNDAITIDQTDGDVSAESSAPPEKSDLPIAERDDHGRWLPGTSPNPKGGAIESYPRNWKELRDLAQSHAPEAIEKLVQIMRRSRSAKIQLAAIELLLDRAYGKAPQFVAIAETDAGARFPANVSPYERARRIAFLLTRPEIAEPPAPLNGQATSE